MIISSCDHTGITVTDLEKSVAFWGRYSSFSVLHSERTYMLTSTISHTPHATTVNVMGCQVCEEMKPPRQAVEEITGVNSDLLIKKVQAPGGHIIECVPTLPLFSSANNLQPDPDTLPR